MAYESAKDYRDGPRANETIPGRQSVAIVAGGTDLAMYVRSLWINTDGTVTGICIEQQGDVPADYVVKAGTPLPVSFRRITACPANTVGFTR